MFRLALRAPILTLRDIDELPKLRPDLAANCCVRNRRRIRCASRSKSETLEELTDAGTNNDYSRRYGRQQGDAWADFGSKWNKVSPLTPDGVTNIAMILCFAVQKGSAIALELDKNGNITKATF
jgi:hypothetical protein